MNHRENVLGLRRWAVTAVLAASLVMGLVAAAPAAGQREDDVENTALAVSAASKPQYVRGTDGRLHIEYDLLITNVFSADVGLLSIDVLDERGDRLLRLDDNALATATTQLLPPTSTTTVPASSTVSTIIDVVLPLGDRSRERALPDVLRHRVRYQFPQDALFHQLIGTSEVTGPTLRPRLRAPVVVSPPLRGDGWIGVNACCEASSHRSFVLAANGDWVTPEVFAIDWTQERDGLAFEGNGAQNSQWIGHGATVHAAAEGKVVEVRENMAEVPPDTTIADNPTIKGPADMGGNHVTIRIGPGVYAFYAHLIPGSVGVKVGERVKTGDRLGRLGNTGNTSAPHLHFGVFDGTQPLSSNALPFELDRFTFAGIAEFTETGVNVSGKRREVRNAHPLFNSVSDF